MHRKIVRHRIINTLLLVALFILGWLSFGPLPHHQQPVVTVGVVSLSKEDQKIWQQVIKTAKDKYHVTVKLKNFTDYNQPNKALANGDLDLNSFQHYAFLDAWNKANHGTLTPVGRTYIAPIRLYSKKYHKLSQLPDGATIVVPNDASNESRALFVLKNAGLIKLKAGKKLVSVADISSNPHHYKIKEVAAEQTARLLSSADASVVNNTYAVPAHLTSKQTIYTEPLNHDTVQWVNVLVARKGNANDKAVKAVVKAYQTKKTEQLYHKLYGNTQLPAWNRKFQEAKLMAQIELKHISVDFSGQDAVRDVSLDIEQGDILGVIGYSGAGKSTLVRTINLLQQPSKGTVKVNGQVLFANGQQQVSAKQLQASRRKIGMIFQNFNLLEEATVFENVAFALKHAGLPDDELEQRVNHLLELVDLQSKAEAYPVQLSGGQQQRVAIARALANKPDILLSDEATSALDPKTTKQILDLLYRLNKKLGLTIVLITHEMDAVKQIASKIAVMKNGRVIEQGPLLDVFLQPKQKLTQEFVGGALEVQEILEKYHFQNLAPQEQLVQLVYQITDVTQSVLADLDQAIGTKASILYGNVEQIGGQPVGTLAVLLPLTPEQEQTAKEFLASRHVLATKLDKEVLTDD